MSGGKRTKETSFRHKLVKHFSWVNPSGSLETVMKIFQKSQLTDEQSEQLQSGLIS
jgi:hypothetical protein